TLGRGIRGQEDSNGVGPIVEGLLHEIALDFVHSTEKREYSVILVAATQAADEIVESRLVLGENDEALVIAPLLACTQKPIDKRHERGVTCVGCGVLVDDVGLAEIQAKAGYGGVDLVDLAFHVGGNSLHPGADDTRGGLLAGLSFTIVAR